MSKKNTNKQLTLLNKKNKKMLFSQYIYWIIYNEQKHENLVV